MIYRHKGDIITRSIAGETILVPIREKLADMERLVVLDGVGGFIWENLDGRKTLDRILEAVVQDFEVTTEDARRDLDDFVAALKEADLIEEAV